MARLGPRCRARPTIRLRLTVTYGVVFLVTGAVLLTIGYRSCATTSNGRSTSAEPSARLPAATVRPISGDAVRQTVRASQLVSDALHRLVIEYLFALGVMTMISVGAGWLLAGRALRPLRDITATARRVSGENLGERIALSGPADELKELADTFDGMLAPARRRVRQPAPLRRQRLARAAHAAGDHAHRGRRRARRPGRPSSDELRAMGEAVRETIDRCERLIEGLLMLARSEAAVGREERRRPGRARRRLHHRPPRPRRRKRRSRSRAALEPAWTHGEPALLERMIANLIDNGIRHNEPGGFLDVLDRARDGAARSSGSCNGGPRIDPAEARDADRAVPAPRPRRTTASGSGSRSSLGRRGARGHARASSAPEAGGLEVRDRAARRSRERRMLAFPQASRALTRS